MSKLKSLFCLKFENTTLILFWFRKPVLKLIFQQIFVCFNTSFKSHNNFSYSASCYNHLFKVQN